MKKRILPAIILSLAAIAAISSCSAPKEWLDTGRFQSMDTLIYVALGDKGAKAQEVANIFYEYESLATKDEAIGNNVYALNGANEPLEVDPKLVSLLRFSLEMKEKTLGYFDPFIGKLSDMWKERLFSKEPSVPSQEEIAPLLEESRGTSLTFFDDGRVQRNGGGEIDLGAIAKGYALKEAAAYLKSKGVSHYIINAGSSSIALGKYLDESKKFDVSFIDAPRFKVNIDQTMIGTSSYSRQYVEIEGVKYTHIINPRDGSAKLGEYDGVSVFAEDGSACDALSTAFMNASYSEAKEIMKEVGGIDKTLYFRNGEIVEF